MIERKYLLDVSRQIHKAWTRSLPTGIERVCHAYLQHFHRDAHAVVHFKGLVRVLDAKSSDSLFELLLDDSENFRSRLMKMAPKALATSGLNFDCNGAFYINVSQTDFQEPRFTYWLRRNRLRPIYLIHDLIPITHPEFCRPIAVQKHRDRVIAALENSSGIIVNSLATGRDLERFAAEQRLPMPPSKAAWISGANLVRRTSASFRSRPYFVVLGTIEGRKNHFMLLQVWRRLVEHMGNSAPKLVIVGKTGTEADHVNGMLGRCHAVRNHVEVLSHCDDHALSRWVANSCALLMPSFAEGFGLPVIEALQAGTPVIASDLPCFREVGQGVPTLLDPLDAASWQRMIVSFVQHGPERQRQLQAMRNFKAPTWREHFAQVESWLERLPRAMPERWRSVAGPNFAPALVDLRGEKKRHVNPADV